MVMMVMVITQMMMMMMMWNRKVGNRTCKDDTSPRVALHRLFVSSPCVWISWLVENRALWCESKGEMKSIGSKKIRFFLIPGNALY